MADGFYEWRKNGKLSIPYYFQLENGAPFAFAGLWDDWENKGVSSLPGVPGLTTCTLITTEANEDVSPVHPRMPVILQKDKMWDGLEESNPRFLMSLLKPLPDGSLTAHQVSREVNSPQSQGAYLTEPTKDTLF